MGKRTVDRARLRRSLLDRLLHVLDLRHRLLDVLHLAARAGAAIAGRGGRRRGPLGGLRNGDTDERTARAQARRVEEWDK
eukprot:3182780-Pyramimonas_sp.AAC.1